MSYQSFLPCVACGKYNEDENHFHHIYTRGSHPEYSEKKWNMISTCSDHHTQGKDSYHAKGMIHMSEKFPSVKEWLTRNGWHLCAIRSKWVHDIEEV